MRLRTWLAVGACCLPAASMAQSAPTSAPTGAPTPAPPPAGVTVLPEVNVIAPTPLLGSGIDRNTVPASTSVVTGNQVVRTGIPDLARALTEDVPGITVQNGAGNPFQPNIYYRGFLASPLQGSPQGLAVYVNGARFNQPFGDVVSWDLIPDVAIDQVNVEGSNPVFGLNALGGAIAVRLKDGFAYHGGELTLAGGSFGRIETDFQYGRQSGTTAAYIAGSVQHEDGWRDQQSSDLYNIYADVGWRGDRAELHFSISAADTELNAPGTTPVDLLAVDPKADFTGPNLIATKYTRVSLNGSYQITDTTSVDVVAYYEYLLQRVVERQRAGFRALRRRLGQSLHRPGHVSDRPQLQPDPRLPERRPLFGARPADDEHQRLRRLRASDQHRPRVRPREPFRRRLQLRRLEHAVQRHLRRRRPRSVQRALHRLRPDHRPGGRLDRAGARRHHQCELRRSS